MLRLAERSKELSNAASDTMFHFAQMQSLKTHQSRRQLFSAAGADGRSRDGASTSSSLPWANGGPAKGLFSSK
jgi:hypothetical protein